MESTRYNDLGGRIGADRLNHVQMDSKDGWVRWRSPAILRLPRPARDGGTSLTGLDAGWTVGPDGRPAKEGDAIRRPLILSTSAVVDHPHPDPPAWSRGVYDRK